MIKKCTGCGIILQTEDINKEGYTENIDNELCLRCFKLKNMVIKYLMISQL